MKLSLLPTIGLSLLLWLLLPLSAHANSFPAQAVFVQQNLVLNGKGTRARLVFNLYNAGLYLNAPNRDANAILTAQEPMAIRLEMTSGQITSQNMEAAVREGFQKSASTQLPALQARIEQLIAVFKEPIQQGDIYDFVYRPQNTVVIKNGRNAAIIPGLDFKQALFGIWLGNQPVQANLKNALLGR